MYFQKLDGEGVILTDGTLLRKGIKEKTFLFKRVEKTLNKCYNKKNEKL